MAQISDKTLRSQIFGDSLKFSLPNSYNNYSSCGTRHNFVNINFYSSNFFNAN